VVREAQVEMLTEVMDPTYEQPYNAEKKSRKITEKMTRLSLLIQNEQSRGWRTERNWEYYEKRRESGNTRIK
jgi:hypothetical protein